MNFTGLTVIQLINEIKKLKRDTAIRYDFGYFSPVGFHSYRGFYEDVAIGFEYRQDNLMAMDFLKQLKNMLGKEIHGWKGGTYIVEPDSYLWVSKDASEANGTVITGVTDLGYGYAILNTAYEDV